MLLLRHSPGSTLHGEGVYSTDLTDPASVDAMFTALRKDYGSIGALIHLLPLQSNAPFAQLDFGRMARAGPAGCPQPLSAGQSGGSRSEAGGQAEWRFTGCGHRPRRRIRSERRRAARTHPLSPPPTSSRRYRSSSTKCSVKWSTSIPSDPVAILRQKLAEELACPRTMCLQIGLPGDRRLTVVPRRSALPAAPITVDRLRIPSFCSPVGRAASRRGLPRTLAKRTSAR